MAPVVAAALIGAGVSVIGGMMGAKAAAEEKRKDRAFQGQMDAFKLQSQAAQAGAQSEQNALGQLVNTYKSAFGA
jgi:hypothetical protein